jgi:hypothetical protein
LIGTPDAIRATPAAVATAPNTNKNAYIRPSPARQTRST